MLATPQFAFPLLALLDSGQFHLNILAPEDRAAHPYATRGCAWQRESTAAGRHRTASERNRQCPVVAALSGQQKITEPTFRSVSERVSSRAASGKLPALAAGLQGQLSTLEPRLYGACHAAAGRPRGVFSRRSARHQRTTAPLLQLCRRSKGVASAPHPRCTPGDSSGTFG